MIIKNEPVHEILVLMDKLICLSKHAQVKINKKFSVKLYKFSYPSILTYVLDAQKDSLNETVLLSTHSICFG